MSVRLYDIAITNKIKSWIPGKNVRILDPDDTVQLFKLTADDSNDKPIKLPLITISRDPDINLSITTKRSLTFDGIHISAYDGDNIPENRTIMHLDAIPMDLTYQIDIYAANQALADEYLRNFLFNIVNSPKLTVELPYNGANIEHVCNMRFQQRVSDGSDIPLRLFPDQFRRWTFSVRIDDAFFFSIPVDTAADITDVSLVLKDKKEESEEFVYSIAPTE